MRTVKKIHHAQSHPIGDLKTYTPLPAGSLDQIDPFLLLNHHGPQEYPPNNHGMPFGPHPHRGMETVTFILDGDIKHNDSHHEESIIGPGGIQWMTAGSGLIHAEVSSEEFKQKGGNLEILQLWINLPARLKMTPPAYKGLQKSDIPTIEPAERVRVNLVAGAWNGTSGGIDPLTDILLSTIQFGQGAILKIQVPTDQNIFCYLIRGKFTVNGKEADAFQLVEFANDDEALEIKALEDGILIFGYATPFNETVVAMGPFVMNSQEEIDQAYQDYQAGKMGVWNE